MNTKVAIAVLALVSTIVSSQSSAVTPQAPAPVPPPPMTAAAAPPPLPLITDHCCSIAAPNRESLYRQCSLAGLVGNPSMAMSCIKASNALCTGAGGKWAGDISHLERQNSGNSNCNDIMRLSQEAAGIMRGVKNGHKQPFR